MTGLLQKISERWPKSVVDQELHSPAARGSARSRTTSAAKHNASRTRQPRGLGAARGCPLLSGLQRPGQPQSRLESEDREGTELPPSGGAFVILSNSMLTV